MNNQLNKYSEGCGRNSEIWPWRFMVNKPSLLIDLVKENLRPEGQGQNIEIWPWKLIAHEPLILTDLVKEN